MATRNLRLVFTNNTGKAVTLTVPEPVDPITPVQIEAVMQSIIDRNVFTSTGGSLVAIRLAEVVVTERTVHINNQ